VARRTVAAVAPRRVVHPTAVARHQAARHIVAVAHRRAVRPIVAARQARAVVEIRVVDNF
jgi:hypothetical protein